MFRPTIDRILLLFRKDKKPYHQFLHILGFVPHNIKLYEQALLHKSQSIHTGDGRRLNNERLEFLGDSILGAVVSDIVYRHFGNKEEGFLTNTRSQIVKRETLNVLAEEIGLNRLIVSVPEATNTHNSHLCGNAFEALIGAIYLDKGYKACYRFLERRILGKYIELDSLARQEVNFKSKLLEWSQKKKYSLEFQSTALPTSQSPMFETVVKIENIDGGTGQGYTKRESQQHAAKQALNRIYHDTRFKQDIQLAKQRRIENATTEK